MPGFSTGRGRPAAVQPMTAWCSIILSWHLLSPSSAAFAPAWPPSPSRCPTLPAAPAWRKQLDEINTRKEGLEADLSARSAAFRSRQALRPGPDQVARAIPPDTALIDLFVYLHTIRPEGGKGSFRRELRLVAFVVRPDRPVALVSLGPVRPMDEAIKRWHRALAGNKMNDAWAAAAAVSRLAWDPLRPHLDGVRTALVVPDGGLAQFPFAALPGSRPGTYLLEDLAIGYVTSGRQLVETRVAPAIASGRGLLAVGGVDFQADTGRAPVIAQPKLAAPPPTQMLVQRSGFVALPNTEPEARIVRDLFRAAHPGEPVDLLTGAGASEGDLNAGSTAPIFVPSIWRPTDSSSPLRESPRCAHPRAPTTTQAGRKPGKRLDAESATFALTPLLRLRRRSGRRRACAGGDVGRSLHRPAYAG